MQDTMADAMLDPPRFTDNGHEVVVELPLRSSLAPMERAWLRKLEHRGNLTGADRIAIVNAARGEILTNARVRELLALDRAAATAVLGRLRDAGFLEQHGRRGGATYRLTGSLNPPSGLRLGEADLLKMVLELSHDRGSVTNSDVRRATGLDRVESLAMLNRLVADGRLKRIEERRGTRYSLP